MKDKITLGKFIQSKRREAGISQKELAWQLFVTESAVSKWERGISYPDITMISGICTALKISEHELCTASEDFNQRKIEQMAVRYKRFIIIYNAVICLCYLAALMPGFISFVIHEHSPSKFFILLTSLMMTASVLNVPTLADKNKALIAFGSFYVSLNLLMLSGSVYSGEGWFFMAFLGVTFAVSIVLLPFLIRIEVFAPYVRTNKALICMITDTVLLMGTIIYGTLRYGTTESLVTGGIFAAWSLVFVWIVFAVVRYAKFNIFFKIAAGLGASAIWLFTTNPVMAFILDGNDFTMDDWHSLNITVVVVASAAVLFAAAGGVYKYIRSKD